MRAPWGPVSAVFFDGETATRHPVRVTLRAHAPMVLQIRGETLDDPLDWPVDRLRALSDQAARDRITVTIQTETNDESPRDPARLVISDPGLVAWLGTTRPNLHRRDLRRGTWRRIGLRAGLAVAAVFLMLFVILPRMADTLATLVPIEREIAFGKSVMAQMERLLGAHRTAALHCSNPEGRDAIETLLARLTSQTPLAYEIEVTVFDHRMANAFAAPGGQVVLIRGLFEQAGSADVVAAVLAHEIGHVEARDPTRLSLRAAGSAGLLSMVLGDFSGGAAVAVAAEYLFRAAYTRDAEAAADNFALGMLNSAGISSEGMAEFFRKLDASDGGGGAPAYLATHPASADRAAKASANAKAIATENAGENPPPALSDTEWAALKDICR